VHLSAEEENFGEKIKKKIQFSRNATSKYLIKLEGEWQ
jgi:hypothetical protein